MPLADLLPARIREARAARKAPAAAPLTQARALGAPDTLPNRSGFVQGVPQGGFTQDAAESQTGAAQNTTRAEWLQCLWEEYLRCPWAWACVNVIARTVTAGGLLMKWDGDDGEGDKKQPDKPAAVLAVERLFAYCNPEQDIRQLARNIVADLQVFGGAVLEVIWFAGIPVALYNQDFPTTYPHTDEHGGIRGWKQITEDGRTAVFKPHQIIHITLDSARPSVFGISPTHAAEEPIVAWMFLHACEKEAARRGLPPNIHVDLPVGYSEPQVERWQNQHAVRNVGPANIGVPLTTKGGGKVQELQTAKLPDILLAKKEARNEIVSSYGVPPAKVGIIESGNLGGGTGSDQNKSFWLDIIAPIAALIAEKLQFALAVKGFGVQGWHVEFGGVDYRDDQTIENIRDMRMRNGSWTRNRYAADIGEPPVEGGDDAVLVARQDIVLWSDMAARSAASVAALARIDATGGQGPGPAPATGTGRPAGTGGRQGPVAPSETVTALAEAVARRLIAAGAVTEHTAKLATGQRVYNQLAKNFPASALKWVKDATWTGPVNVPADQIATEDRDQWAATADRAKVARFRKRYKRAGKMKPAILVRAPGRDKDVIADGHHHVLAAIELGYPIRAYVGHVDKAHGGWELLSTRQKRTTAKTKETAGEPRMSKADAGYGPATSPGVRCGTCAMFVDDRCTLVQGDIDPAAVCSQWQAGAGAARVA